MNKLKLILPMLAFVMAIGLSFAFADTTGDKDYFEEKYILVEAPDGWATIDVECDPQGAECSVRFSAEPAEEYTVYNSQDLGDPALGNGQVMILNGTVPNPD